MTSRRTQHDKRRSDSESDHSFAALEQELHAKQPRATRRTLDRTAARAEAEGYARVTGKHYRGGISA